MLVHVYVFVRAYFNSWGDAATYWTNNETKNTQRHHQAFHRSTKCKMEQECCILFNFTYIYLCLFCNSSFFVIQYIQSWLQLLYCIHEIKIFKKESSSVALRYYYNLLLQHCYLRFWGCFFVSLKIKPSSFIDDHIIIYRLSHCRQHLSDCYLLWKIKEQQEFMTLNLLLYWWGVSPWQQSDRWSLLMCHKRSQEQNRFPYVKGQLGRSLTSLPFLVRSDMREFHLVQISRMTHVLRFFQQIHHKSIFIS